MVLGPAMDLAIEESSCTLKVLGHAIEADCILLIDN